MRFKPIGMRTIKTGISVGLTLLVCNALKVENPFFALIASSMAVESSVSESLNVSKNRMIGTMIGALLAIIFSLILPTQPLSVGLGIIALIYISNTLELRKSIKISAIVFVAILVNNDETTRIQYAIFRSFDTFIGLSIGSLVNYYIKPPNSFKDFNTFIEEQLLKATTLYQDSVSNKPHDLNLTLTALQNIDAKLKLLKRESKYNLHPFNERAAFKEALEKLLILYTHLNVLAKVPLTSDTQITRLYHLDTIENLLKEEVFQLFFEKS